MRRLAKTGSEADRASCPAFAQRLQHVDGEIAVDPDEGRVRCAWQVGDRAEGADARHLVLLVMDRPDGAGKTHLEALLNDVGCKEPAADDSDRFRPQKSVEAAHPPTALSSAREMI